MTQRDRILAMLQQAGPDGATNVRLNYEVCFAYSQRIGELKRLGHKIDCLHEGNSVWRYFWRGKREAEEWKLTA